MTLLFLSRNSVRDRSENNSTGYHVLLLLQHVRALVLISVVDVLDRQ